MKYIFIIFCLAILAIQLPAAGTKHPAKNSYPKNDTSYVSIKLTYHYSKKGRYTVTTSDINAGTLTAPVVTRGANKVLTVIFPSAANKTFINSLLAGKIISRQYADNYLSLAVDGNYKSTSPERREAGSTVDDALGAIFMFQYSDDPTDPNSTSFGVNISTSVTEKGPNNEAKTYKSVAVAGFAGTNIPGDIMTTNSDKEAQSFTVNKTKQGYLLSCHRTKKDSDGEVTDETFTAVIGAETQKYEAVIMPVEEGDFKYQEWLPTGPKTNSSNDTKGDNQLKFKIVVTDKKNPAVLYPGSFTIKWSLQDVSAYPGICNNYPAYIPLPNTDNDLQFDPSLENNPAFDATGDIGSAVSSKMNLGASATVQIMCMDYAAWGKLTAMVSLDDGSLPITANPYYSKKLSYLTIPYDADENKLADAWEIANNIFRGGHLLTWDEDKFPEKQKDNGDGYTLFEEYRGFAVHQPADAANPDVHVRTDPNKKDAFVYDRDKLFETYYEPLNPSGLNWNYLSKDKEQFVYFENDKLNELHRWVNFNKTEEYFYDKQYAAVLFFSTGSNTCTEGNGATAAGVTFGREEYDKCNLHSGVLSTNEFNSPLKNHVECVVYGGRIQESKEGIPDPATKIKIIAALTGNTVRHEIGHYIGISHHQTTAKIKGTLGGDPDYNNSIDGVLDCLMRYPNPKEAFDYHPGGSMSLEFTTYCKDNQPGFLFLLTERRDAQGNILRFPEDNKIKYNIQTTARICNDNCYGQITVKSKPGE